MRTPAFRCRLRGPSGLTSERERGDFLPFPFPTSDASDAIVHHESLVLFLPHHQRSVTPATSVEESIQRRRDRRP